jgi:hypothetical protein
MIHVLPLLQMVFNTDDRTETVIVITSGSVSFVSRKVEDQIPSPYLDLNLRIISVYDEYPGTCSAGMYWLVGGPTPHKTEKAPWQDGLQQCSKDRTLFLGIEMPVVKRLHM